MEGVTVLYSFMFNYDHVGTFLMLTYIGLFITGLVYVYCEDYMYQLTALITTAMLSVLCIFSAMNLNIPWQHVTIDETVVVEEFFENYKILDVKDGIYFVRPLDN